MRGRVTKSDEARTDLLNHFRYIGRHNLGAARRFLAAAKKAMELLAWMPEIGSIWESPHPFLSGVRVWPIRKFKNYLIFYCRSLEASLSSASCTALARSMNYSGNRL